MQVHSDMPFGVKYCRVVNMIYMVVFCLAGLALSVVFVGNYFQTRPEGAPAINPIWIFGAGLIFFVVGITLAYLLKQLNDSLKELSEKARQIQVVISFSMLVVGFPLGTLLYGVALYFLLADAATKEAFS